MTSVAATCSALAGANAAAMAPPPSAVTIAASRNHIHCTPWKRAVRPVRSPFSTMSASMITSEAAVPKAVSVRATTMVPASVSPDSHRNPVAAVRFTSISQVLRR